MEQIKLLPKRRFNGFRDEWELRKLGDEVEFYSGLTYSPSDVIKSGGTLVLRSSNIKDGEIVDADNVYVSSEVVNSDNVEIGDIIVVVRNGSRSLIGKHAQIKEKMDNTVIGAFMTGVRYQQAAFMNALLSTPQFKSEVEKNMGATINQITTGSFKEMEFYFPNVDEQKYIGEFFLNLDNHITLQQYKVEKTKALKSAYLAEMFPAEGERVPKRRFEGFTDDWGQCELGEVADIIGGGTPSTGNEEYWGGDIDWYSPVEIGDQTYVSSSQKKITELGLQKSSAKILPIGTVLFTSRAGIGNTAILAKEGATNQGFQSIVPHKDELDSYFIYSRTHELKRYGESNGAGSTFVEVSGKQMAKMPILIPTLEEQIKIGNFFKQLDDMISNQQRKLDKLKAMKQAYLHEMFV